MGGQSLGDRPQALDRINRKRFADLIGELNVTGGSGPEIAIAVSGGADSLALALLAHHWALARKGRAVALTVDHGLRPESAAEAAQVGGWLAARGIDHHVLRCPPFAPGGNLQARAREARYDLLTAWCRHHRIFSLLLAHHRDDQAETFLLRLARGSGVDGLSAMSAQFMCDGVCLLRPLLTVPKAALVAYLKNRKQPWVEDPSNRNDSYARVRMRKLLPLLAAEGLTAERLATTAAHLDRSREALSAASWQLIEDHAEVDGLGYALLKTAWLGQTPEDIATRTLAYLLMLIGGQVYKPRYGSLQSLTCDLKDHGMRPEAFAGRTLAGCRILPYDEERVILFREMRGIEPPVSLAAGRVTWDGRCEMLVGTGDVWRDCTLGALGKDDWLALKRQYAIRPPRGVPAAVFSTLAAVRDPQGVLHVPQLNWMRPMSPQDADLYDDYTFHGPQGRLRTGPRDRD